MLKRLAFLAGIGLGALALHLTAAAAEQSWPWPSERFSPQQQRNVAGVFDYYVLVLSWSPTYCATARDGGDESQCARRDGRRYSFVLHGLWPQYEQGFPQDCRLNRRPFVPQQTIDRMLDVMPSPGLIIHEYRKHGTCSGLDANAYFSTARSMLGKIRIPKRFDNPFEAQFVKPAEIVDEFTRANAGLTADMMAVDCSGGSPNRLREIRFCFTKDGARRACGGNENRRRLCASDSVFVPPSRSTARDANVPGSGETQSSPRQPLPKPRVLDSLDGI